MSEQPDQDQKSEAPTEKRRRDAAEQGDVLQSRELGTALVVLAAAAWLGLGGPLMMESLGHMLTTGLAFDAEQLKQFDPGQAALRLIGIIAVPLLGLFALTIVAAIGSVALLGSLGFRSKAFSFKASKLNPLTGLKRMVGMQGLIELAKSLAKVALLGGVGVWLLSDISHQMSALGTQPIGTALSSLGGMFVRAIMIMAFALAAIALIDVPSQIMQRSARLRMSKQELKDESKQTDGSPELKAAVRRRQFEVLRASARAAVRESTVVLTNPTHFAVALRYRLGTDGAPVVVARGRGAVAEAIRDLAQEHAIPVLSYPQLARAIYFTARTGQTIREDLYIAVATVLAFVFSLDTAAGQKAEQPPVDVPLDARFDEKGRRET